MYKHKYFNDKIHNMKTGKQIHEYLDQLVQYTCLYISTDCWYTRAVRLISTSSLKIRVMGDKLPLCVNVKPLPWLLVYIAISNYLSITSPIQRYYVKETINWICYSQQTSLFHTANKKMFPTNVSHITLQIVTHKRICRHFWGQTSSCNDKYSRIPFVVYQPYNPRAPRPHYQRPRIASHTGTLWLASGRAHAPRRIASQTQFVLTASFP